MLESMQEKPRPTRAESISVANAIYDGTDAIMLSGESAQGKYPEEAVLTMNKIAHKIEGNLDYASIFKKRLSELLITLTLQKLSVCQLLKLLQTSTFQLSSPSLKQVLLQNVCHVIYVHYQSSLQLHLMIQLN